MGALARPTLGLLGSPKLAYSVSETIRILSIGRTKLYALIASGELRPIKIGRKTLISHKEIENFLERLQNMGGTR